MEFTRVYQYSASAINLHNIKLIFKQLAMQISYCDLCGQAKVSYPLLCSHCFNDLAIFSSKHTQGDLLNWPAINHALPHYQFDHLICLAPYLWPFSHWLSQFKYQGRFELTPLFATLLNNYWRQIQDQYQLSIPKLILSVPTHISRWQERGFNQAHLIAKEFSIYSGLPYESSVLYRDQATQKQVGKGGAQRRKNLRHAFKLSNTNIDLPSHIMLIDDVVTTGSTANAICRLLKQHGVQKITLMAVCLSLPST